MNRRARRALSCTAYMEGPADQRRSIREQACWPLWFNAIHRIHGDLIAVRGPLPMPVLLIARMP